MTVRAPMSPHHGAPAPAPATHTGQLQHRHWGNKQEQYLFVNVTIRVMKMTITRFLRTAPLSSPARGRWRPAGGRECRWGSDHTETAWHHEVQMKDHNLPRHGGISLLEIPLEIPLYRAPRCYRRVCVDIKSSPPTPVSRLQPRVRGPQLKTGRAQLISATDNPWLVFSQHPGHQVPGPPPVLVPSWTTQLRRYHAWVDT